VGSISRKIVVHTNPGIKEYSKITNMKRAGGVTQVVECLPSKYQSLSSNPSTTQKTAISIIQITNAEKLS
jgi:hypothetical protein